MTKTTLIALPGSKISLSGRSTLRAFASSTSEIRIEGILAPGAHTLSEALSGKLSSFRLTLPLIGFKSGDSTLDEHLRTALKHQPIQAEMKEYQSHALQAAPDSFDISASFNLSVAGKTKELSLSFNAKLNEDFLVLNGETELRMTDFGITPPTLLLGTLKTKNEVQVKIHLRIGV